MALKKIGTREHNQNQWQVLFEENFAAEVRQMEQAVREELKAAALILSRNGPLLSRPYADTLKGSRHANMKELRFSVHGSPWRVAYAFDPDRKAVLLVGGDKGGVGQSRFYQNLIRVADDRFDRHLQRLLRKGKDERE